MYGQRPYSSGPYARPKIVTATGGGSATGTLAATETPDSAAFAGSVSVSGSFAVTEQADTAAFAGPANVSGSLAATESPDTASFIATGVSGTLAATEGPDSAAISATYAVRGSFATTEPQDAASFTGANTGTLAATEAADVLAFNISVSNPASGQLVVTEFQDSATFAALVTASQINPLGKLKMYTGSLGAISNREDWVFSINLIQEDGSQFDISGASIVTYICLPDSPNSPALTASTSNGLITLTDAYTLQWHFDAASMGSLCNEQYSVFCRMTIGGYTTQILAASVAILDGGPT